ncbi:MAG: amidohydrolase [Paraburkholderia tropica]
METSLQEKLQGWRRQLHQHPETGFEEVQTSDYVANILKTLGMDVHRNIGGTGLVANLKVGNGTRAIGLRAEMDALNIAEQAPGRLYASCNAGKMHDGLFERFPVDAIFGVHNMPGLPAGSISTRSGGVMASEDNFVIHIKARGTHAARPHMGVDPVVIAAQIVLALQTIVSRNLDPSQSAVISCTEIITDGLRNVIPSNVVIKGDTRSYSPDVQRLLATRMREVSEGICRTHGAECTFEYTHEFVPTVNTPAFVDVAAAAASMVVGADKVDANVQPMMISEDFGAFLQVVPGNFAFIGNGIDSDDGGTPLHNAGYDFNDSILTTGARYFAEIARMQLAAR